MRLRIHAERRDVPDGARPAPILYPFWGPPETDEREVGRTRFAKFVEEGPALFELSSFEEADVVVFPAAWETVTDFETARVLATRAAKASKPFVVFFISDSTDPVMLPGDLFVFRTSLSRSRRRPGEHALPAWSEDFVEAHLGGEIPVRAWSERPTVGFCGYDPPASSLPRPLARMLGRAGPTARRRALEALRRSDAVEANIVMRNAFFGGVIQPDGSVAFEIQQRVRAEYVQNMVESDYALAVRGAGNFSYRLYEAMSCGRVPAFVDTDSVLPCDDLLDWDSLCVWVDEFAVDKIGSLIRARHATLDDVSFAELQERCRAAWEQHLSPHGYFRQFRRHFTR